MLEYSKRDGQAKKATKTWTCVKCGVSMQRGEAWIEDRGPLCQKHGMRLRLKRLFEALR